MTFQPITASEARGNSEALTYSLLAKIAEYGEVTLANSSKHTSLCAQFSSALVGEAYKATRDAWGGLTIDLRTGQSISRDHGYAVTTGTVHVRIDSDSSEETLRREMFDASRKIPAGQFLGVFHDSDLGVVDIDSVFVTDSAFEVTAIGVARHSTGGAYDFATGDALWMPYLSEES